MEAIRRLIASDIPFARDDAHRMLPAMIACLIGFAALLLALAVSLSDGVRANVQAMDGMLQIELPKPLADKKETLDRVVGTVRRTPGVVKVDVLRNEAMEDLLKPWMGKEFSLGDLPVPAMLDVTTKVAAGKTAVDVAALQTALAAIDRRITLEDRGPWANQMQRATTLLQGLVVLVAVLLLACVLGMIVLVARTNLKLHFKAVSLLHMFGATDDYILRQFQWNNAALAARGAAAGTMFAALVFGGWVVLSHRWDSPILPPVSFGIGHALTFLFLPIITAVTAFAATRLTVRGMLQHMH